MEAILNPLVGVAGAIDGEYNSELAGGSAVDIGKPAYIFTDKRKQYDQAQDDPYGCVWYSIMGQISDNIGYDFMNGDRASLRTLAPNYGWVLAKGMLLAEGGNMIVDYWNGIFKDTPIGKLPIKTYSDDLMKYLNLGWSINIGSYVNAGYFNDLNADGDIDDAWLESGTGHARRIFKNPKDGKIYIIENYANTLKYNVIEITEKAWENLMKNTVFFHDAFIYYPLRKMAEIKPHNTGDLPEEREIVREWERRMDLGAKYHYKVYTDRFYITKMLNDIAFADEKGIQ